MLQTSTEFGGVMSADVRVIQARFLLLGVPLEGNIKKITVNLGTGCENGFQPGTLYSSYITARIEDCTERLENQKITLQIGAVLPDETVEWVTVGVYTVGAPDTDAYGTEFTAYGSLSTKFGGTYNVNAAESIGVTVEKLEAQTGCTIDTSAFPDAVLNLVPAQAFRGLQRREVLMYIASLLGGFATETADGNVRIGTYQTQTTMSIDADRTTELFTFHDLDHIITGVSVIVSEDTEDEDGNTVAGTVYSYETPNLVLTNPYMTQALFNHMAQAVTGLRFRPATLPITMGDIRLEAGDMLSVTDVSGAVYTVPCLGVVHTYEGGLETTVTAVGSSETEHNANFSGSLSARVERSEVGLAIVREAVVQKASIKDLSAVRAKIESLDVDALNAVDATIKFLQSDVANIQTIMSGQIGTGELQALHLTSGNVVIDDAVITDAMIAGLSAGKINAGTIYTNLVKIASDENENLLIDGSTIQIKDANGTVRVQIGKDTQGDYSYYLWDADGNLMWNPTGITEQGLNPGVIKDVAIADDAAISGSKLDIDSVSERLNEEGSLVVDSSHVTVNDTTLDVSFQTITQKAENAESAANEAKDATSTLQTDMSVIQGKIENKVWQTDIDDAVGTISDQYTQVVQDMNGISSTVSKMESTTGELASRLDTAETNITQNANQITIGVREAKAAAETAQSTADAKLSAGDISLSVTNNGSSASISLKAGNKTSTANVNITGFVTFSNLKDGKTTISGSNIITGEIWGRSITISNTTSNNIRDVKNIKNSGYSYVRITSAAVYVRGNSYVGLFGEYPGFFDINRDGSVKGPTYFFQEYEFNIHPYLSLAGGMFTLSNRYVSLKNGKEHDRYKVRIESEYGISMYAKDDVDVTEYSSVGLWFRDAKAKFGTQKSKTLRITARAAYLNELNLPLSSGLLKIGKDGRVYSSSGGLTKKVKYLYKLKGNLAYVGTLEFKNGLLVADR